jgi:hypothetical protein
MIQPLILAIEPDRRQASQLKAAVRGRLRADLVLADTADAALTALGDRVPDLVLTSAFLSPKDENALADWLRALDAAHVQTLTIPVLDAPREPANGARGMLSGLLRDRAHTPAAPDGCDPAVFADQCAAYLERAAGERVTQIAVPDEAVIQEAVPVDEPEPVEQLDLREDIYQLDAQIAVEAAIEAPQEEPAPAASPQAGQRGFDIDLSSLLDEAVVHELSAAIENVTASDSTSSPQARPAPRAHKWKAMPIGNKTLRPRMEGKASESPAPPHVADAPASRARQTSTPRPKRTPNAKPAQDEWGLFDPAQCGFATLLAKLDEITEVASPLPTVSSSAGSLDVSR